MKNGFYILFVAKGAKHVVFNEVATKGYVQNTTDSNFIYRGPYRKARLKV
jgi:hypothetical protein